MNKHGLIQTALRSILRNKGRSFLTSLGIIIGVTSVVLLSSIGNGIKSYISELFESMGSNMIMVMSGNSMSEDGGFQNHEGGFLSSTNAKFEEQHIKKIQKLPEVLTIAPVAMLTTRISFAKNTKTSSILASTEDLAHILNLKPSSGRFFNQTETEQGAKVVVLGHTIASDLFNSLNPLGKSVKIDNKRFEVIGVIEEKGGNSMGPGLDDHVYIPLKKGHDLAGNNDISFIYLQATSTDTIDRVKSQITNVLLEDFASDSFSVVDQAQLLNSIGSILTILTTGLSGIAAISLLVGGIGIMNIMLVTVTERTREIGLRKAVGAKPKVILFQFLLEAVILSLLGGTIGIILGYLGTLGINHFFPAKVSLFSVILSFSVAFMVGVIFGATPARRASRLSPITALRYE